VVAVIRPAAVDPLEAGGLLLERRPVAAVMDHRPGGLPAAEATVPPAERPLAVAGALLPAGLLVAPAGLLLAVPVVVLLGMGPLGALLAALLAVPPATALPAARLLAAAGVLPAHLPAGACRLATCLPACHLAALGRRPATGHPEAPLPVAMALPVDHPVAAMAGHPATGLLAVLRAVSLRPAVAMALPVDPRLAGVALHPAASSRRRRVAALASGHRWLRSASVGTP
jgi:hypothetical protein